MTEQQKVITFWSPASGVGTTFTAINAAKRLAQKGFKVLLLDFDLPNPSVSLFFQSQRAVQGLDNLIPHISGGQLTPSILESQILEHEGLFYLRGSNTPEKSHYIQADHLRFVLQVARELFDYLVIDTKGIIDHAGSFVGLSDADRIMVVLDKNVLTLQRYFGLRGLLESSFDMNRFSLLLNKNSKAVHMETDEAQSFTNLLNSFELPDLGAELINSINQGKWEAYVSGGEKAPKTYIAAMDHLLEGAVIQNFSSIKEVKRSPFAKLFGK